MNAEEIINEVANYFEKQSVLTEEEKGIYTILVEYLNEPTKELNRKKAITGRDIIEHFTKLETNLFCPMCFTELQEYPDEEILVCRNLQCGNASEYKPDGSPFYRNFKELMGGKSEK